MTNNKLYQMEVFSMIVLLLIPWHGPIIPRPPCPREKASLVRKVVSKKWVPILEKVGAALPLDCPLHPARDIFKLHDSRKRHYSPQWTCGFCGKSFYYEPNLDAHMELKHEDKLNMGEDTICVAEYCDVMRCEVLHERLQELEELTPTATALDVWHKPMLISSKRSSYQESKKLPGVDQAIERALPRNLMRTTPKSSWTRDHPSGIYSSPSSSAGFSEKPPRPSKSPSPQSFESQKPRTQSKDDLTKAIDRCPMEDKSCQAKSEKLQHHDEDDPDLEEPPELPMETLHSWRDACNEEHLAELRVKCQQLIQQCVSGLVLNLTLEQVRDVEGAFHRSVCWYLTCERYWEAGTMEPPEFPWGVVSTLVLLLTFGVSMCYYIVWVLCESVVDSAANTPVTTEPHPSIVSHAGGSTSKTILNSSMMGGCSSRGNSLGRSTGGASASRARFSATESESECRDSGFNEGALYPEYETQELPGGDINANRSRHYSEDSRLSLPTEETNSRPYGHEERVYNYASSFTPNYEQRRLRRNRYNYLDDFDAYTQIDNDSIDSNGGLSRERSDSFIYVSYPPEVKKRFQESR